MKYRDLKIGDSLIYIILDESNISDLDGMKLKYAKVIDKINDLHIVTDELGDMEFQDDSELDLESSTAESEDSILILSTTNDGVKKELKKLLESLLPEIFPT
jgi:hypothetical protein